MASRPPENSPPAEDARARNRWMVLQATRFAGFGLAILGILMVEGVGGIEAGTGKLVGYALIVLGLADGFVMPQVLARRWRTPPQ